MKQIWGGPGHWSFSGARQFLWAGPVYQQHKIHIHWSTCIHKEWRHCYKTLTYVTSAAPLILTPVERLQHRQRLNQNAFLLLQDGGKIGGLAEVLTHNVADKVPHGFAGSIGGSWNHWTTYYLSRGYFNLLFKCTELRTTAITFNFWSDELNTESIGCSYQESECPHLRWWGVGGHEGKPLSQSDSLICESIRTVLKTEHQLNKSTS